jgi:hypothetical protein
MSGFKGKSVVACGTVRREIRKLTAEGFLDADRILFTAPGLHEWQRELEKQLLRQLKQARAVTEQVVVVYGERCYLSPVDPNRNLDTLLREQASEYRRIRAKHCVDMLADEEQRGKIAAGDKVYWLTPGWIEHWDHIFKDWDEGKANEMFPAYDKAVVLDALGYYDELCERDPEKVLRIADWMKIPVEAHPVGLDRLKGLLAAEAGL